MNFSFWEHDSWFSNFDFTVIGSGITGLNAALQLKSRFPASKILVVERGLLPEGASTKNAGFACFGSLSEIIDDLATHSEEEVAELVQKRVKGLELLRRNLGDKNLDYQSYGGYELFTEQDKALFESCASRMGDINRILRSVFGKDVFSVRKNSFGFKNIIDDLIYSKFEGQLDTGKMMSCLLKKAQEEGIRILNNLEVVKITEDGSRVQIDTPGFSFKSRRVLIATNGFAAGLGIEEVKPARAQVLITKPISNLTLKGTFHLDRGYYYFRNIDKRILFGGGRNLDFKSEETTEFALTEIVQQRLEEVLRETILPGQRVEIERRWSGIMGVGNQKKPIVKKLSENVYCGVRLGGMGVAIGSLVGIELANLIES